MQKTKVLEIGPYPPPNSGWSVRIKYLKEAFGENGHDCKVLNLGKNRKIKSPEYIDVQSGSDYLKKLILLRLKGYHFHIHVNAQAVKGPILSLAAQVISLLTFERATLTFHGGIDQLYFPRENAKKMYWIIYLNFLLAKLTVCNNEPIKKKIVDYGLLVSENKIHPIPAFSVQYLKYNEVQLPEEVNNFIRGKKYVIVCYIVLRNGFFIETLIEFLKRVKPDIGIILSGIGEPEDKEVVDYYRELQNLEADGTVLTVSNLDHDQFMTLLAKSDIYLRTPVSDGVASSVLEALSVGTQVVASENKRRPAGVLTYKADSTEDMHEKVYYVLDNLDELKKKAGKPEIKDTVKDELELLLNSFL
ncbi:MAG: glycosyltransferase family 4 protein [Desulfobacterales bacterium]|nr:glycosyltransferase family 4 protein [Desulfobacterales bacterium]